MPVGVRARVATCMRGPGIAPLGVTETMESPLITMTALSMDEELLPSMRWPARMAMVLSGGLGFSWAEAVLQNVTPKEAVSKQVYTIRRAIDSPEGQK